MFAATVTLLAIYLLTVLFCTGSICMCLPDTYLVQAEHTGSGTGRMLEFCLVEFFSENLRCMHA